MQTDTELTITGLVDQMLDDGWSIATWQKFDDWPDTWALVRDWAPDDPKKNPKDVIHLLQYGTSVVRDIFGFHTDATAAARRIHLLDKTVSWSQVGPATLTAKRMSLLSAPLGCHRIDGSSDLPWGAHTTRVLARFRARDWQLTDTDDGGRFEYSHGVGTAELARPRFDHELTLEPLGIWPLTCHVEPDLTVRIIGWGVHTGCEIHRGSHETVAFHHSDLSDALGRFESATTTADLRQLAYCLVFGDCSWHELDMSKEE